MIKNSKHNNIVKERLENAKRALLKFTKEADPNEDPEMYNLQIAMLEGRIADLTAEIEEYEQLSSGELTWLEGYDIYQLSDIIIKARLARGWSHKKLAEELGIDEQQIQRYEYKDYEQAKLSRVLEVLYALDVKLEFKPIYIGEPVHTIADDFNFDIEGFDIKEINSKEMKMQNGALKVTPLANN